MTGRFRPRKCFRFTTRAVRASVVRRRRQTFSCNPPIRSASVGGTAVFQRRCRGHAAAHLSMAIFKGTNNIAITTDPSLVLTNVQLGHAGNYQVVVTNIAGAATSSVAVLTVSLCTPGAPGLVAWYTAEGNTYDSARPSPGWPAIR